MGGWRKKRDEFNYHEVQRTSRNYRKPPAAGSWQAKVPSWEKQFCASVGAVPWHKLLETKKCMFLYENVVQWNDSAGEEAFNNAKSRYWANINGLPCNISLPDPNIYIDEIDWNPDMDPKLLLELEQEPEEFPIDGDKEAVLVGLALPMGEFACAGWGDTDENFRKPDVDQNPWEGNGWGNGLHGSLGLNSWEKNVDACQNSREDNRDGTPQNADKNTWEGNRCGNDWESSLVLNLREDNMNAFQNSWENRNETPWNVNKNSWEENGLDGSLGSWENNINACQPLCGTPQNVDKNTGEGNSWDGSLGSLGSWGKNINTGQNSWGINRDGAPGNDSLDKSSKFHGDHGRMDRGWGWNGRWRKRANFVY